MKYKWILGYRRSHGTYEQWGYTDGHVTLAFIFVNNMITQGFVYLDDSSYEVYYSSLLEAKADIESVVKEYV